MGRRWAGAVAGGDNETSECGEACWRTEGFVGVCSCTFLFINHVFERFPVSCVAVRCALCYGPDGWEQVQVVILGMLASPLNPNHDSSPSRTFSKPLKTLVRVVVTTERALSYHVPHPEAACFLNLALSRSRPTRNLSPKIWHIMMILLRC